MEGVARAARIAAFVGFVTAVWGVLMLGGDDFTRLAGKVSIGLGVLYLGLAYGISKESRAAALVAALLYTLAFVLMVVRAASGVSFDVGIFIRFFLMLALWRGFLDCVLQARFRTYNEQQTLQAPPVPRRTSAPPLQPVLDGPREVRPRSDRQVPPKPDLPAPGAMMCPNCHKTYAKDVTMCPACKVGVFET